MEEINDINGNSPQDWNGKSTQDRNGNSAQSVSLGELTSELINSLILTLSAETETDTELKYFTDYGEYTDPTNLRVVPANTYEANRTPGTRPENSNRPAVFRRRPMCRRVIHFSFQLRNNHRGEDLAIESAEVFFEKVGRLR